MKISNSNYKDQKVILIIPNTSWYDRKPVRMVEAAPLILSAILKDQFDFRIIDANGLDLTEEQLLATLEEVRPDVAMVSCLSFEYYLQFKSVLLLAKKANLDCITVIGGVYPTLLGAEALKDTGSDYAFVGHAEERVLEFLKLVIAKDEDRLVGFDGICFKKDGCEMVDNPIKTFISDVTEQVKPDYSHIDFGLYVNQTSKDYQFNSDKPAARILTSYGCPYDCVFCSTRGISGRGVAYREIDDVMEEIDYLMSNYGVQNLVFLDDFFLAKKKRCMKLM